MRTKRYAALFLAAALALSLAGCGINEDKNKDKDGDMTIQPAQLTEEETALLDLLAINTENYRIFDFRLKENSGVQSMRLAVYELREGEWASVSQADRAFTDSEGRIAFTVGRVTDGVTTAVQSASGSGSNTYTPIPGDDVSGMAFATSKLSGATAIELDQEIPLMLQVATAKSEFTTYEVDYFGMPRELAKHGYEHVYAVTVTFSEKTPAQLDQVPPSSGPSSAS